MNEKLKSLLDARYDFIRSHGGSFGVTEGDWELNDLNRSIITEYYNEYPDCWVGNINQYGKNVMQKYNGEMVHNFEWTFIISQYNQELKDLIVSYNAKEYSDCLTSLNMVFDKLSHDNSLNTIGFDWV